MHAIIASNPFVSSYLQSDGFGKMIFLMLFSLSAICWSLLVYKSWVFVQAKKLSKDFAAQFSEKDLLNMQFQPPKGHLLEVPNPFFEIYKAMKQKVFQLMNRNHYFAPEERASLFEADLSMIESYVYSAVATQHKKLEKNLFLLSTVATLGPFLGLLGTVWGILITFSQIPSRGIAISNAAMLSGLSMALTTTVIGLLIAIPALVGYNYLKNSSREFLREMEDFSQMLLASVELQYRKPDHAKTLSIPS